MILMGANPLLGPLDGVVLDLPTVYSVRTDQVKNIQNNILVERDKKAYE
jgi:hypothetical protein